MRDLGEGLGEGLSRAGFLRRRAVTPPPTRPPWALRVDAAFRAGCDGCGACIPVCEPAIISADAEGRPVVSFADAGCTLCGACADACHTPALSREEGRRPWNQVARIGASCLSYGGVECRVCGEHCSERAITFRPMLGGRLLPLMNETACTGCGACIGPCPTRAVEIKPITDSQIRPGESPCA